jgi:sec-independent protein translocase protein TatB
VFDLSVFKLLSLAGIALVIFGPNVLPKMAAQAGRLLRELRRIADGARSDLRAGLGPEFQDFDFNDLNPKQFVRKHLLDDLEAGFNAPSAGQHSAGQQGASAGQGAGGLQTQRATLLAPGETPPYDLEAT